MTSALLPIPEFFPTLCVMNLEDHARAVQIIREREAADAENSGTEITCPKCAQSNPGNFDTCWSCSAELLSPTGPST